MTTAKTIATAVTENTCNLCAPLGAALAFKGIRGTVPLLHGSQGCATYIRRYLISHFKEPIDIASSNFHEETAVFGGGANLKTAMRNVTTQYAPELIGIASTCLAETIGDNVPMILHDLKDEDLPEKVFASTPSYAGSHSEGYWTALNAVCDRFVEIPETDTKDMAVNLFPAMVTPADLRQLNALAAAFGLRPRLLPDYSTSLDGGPWGEYRPLPDGGTPLSTIRKMGASLASIHLGSASACSEKTPAKGIADRCGVPDFALGLPVGVHATDKLLGILSDLSGRPVPGFLKEERDRLIDAYVDGHKIVSGLTAVIYGEEDLVCAMAGFLEEIGITPAIIATGGRSGNLKTALKEILPASMDSDIQILEGADFATIEAAAQTLKPDLFIGSSKGYAISRKTGTPLIRVGFPIHDRVGGPRILHLGYQGAQTLFDRICNAILEVRQEATGVGFSYL